MKFPEGLISGSDLCIFLFSLPLLFPHTLPPLCLSLSLKLPLSPLSHGPLRPQKKIMIIICCVVLGVVLASSIGGTLGL